MATLGKLGKRNNQQPRQQTDHEMKQQQSSQPKPQTIKAHRGLLISCDGALKQFLLRLNEKSNHKFVMRDLDENHLFVNDTRYPQSFENVQQWLQHEVDEWNKKYTYIDETDRVDD
eukprot:187922_1